MRNVKCLNPWDVQSKHILIPDGIAESMCSGEKRWGGLPPNVLYEVKDEMLRNRKSRDGLPGDDGRLRDCSDTE